MSSTGSNVYPDIIVFPPDQVADITDEERAVLLCFKDFLDDQKFAAHSVPDAAGTMKSQMREHLIRQEESLTETEACGTREIHNHKVALASESTRGWWSNRGGGNIHHPSSTTSPKWPQKQGPHGGDEHLSFP